MLSITLDIEYFYLMIKRVGPGGGIKLLTCG